MNPLSTITAGLSLGAAASWGAADFSGGIATKKSNAFGVVVVAHGTGLVFMLVLALLLHDPLPDRTALLWGIVAGFSGGIGLAAFYRALAVGQMGVNAPIAAVLTALFPVIVGFREQGLPTTLQFAGFALALLGIWLLASPPGQTAKPKGIGLAIVAGLGFSGFLVCSRYAGTHSLFWPLVAARAASIILMLTIVLASRVEWRPDRKALVYMIVAGILDSTGNALFVAATQHGRLDVAAVLSSFYPASTVLLARFILKERISPLQGAGIFAALMSVPLIAMR
jgi:drug/metabolite transporter (DMT)-like permease